MRSKPDSSLVAREWKELQGVVRDCRSILPSVEAFLPALVRCLKGGNKLLACGNGGSAADALHLVEELVGRYRANRRPWPAVCLNADSSILTCIANDWQYEVVFERQVDALGQKGDFLVAFSTSGKSPSILRAIQKGREKGLHTLALLGKDGGPARGMAEHEVIIPSQNTARIQEIHGWILHVILEHVEAQVVA